MKKPNFNFFYSLSVNKLLRKGNAPQAAPAGALKAAPDTIVESEEKITYIKQVEAKIKKLDARLKKVVDPKIHKIFGTKMSLNEHYIQFKGLMDNVKTSGRDKLYANTEMNHKKFAEFKKTMNAELKSHEKLIENMENKQFIAAKLKKIFEDTVLEYVRKVDLNTSTNMKLVTASDKREMLIMTSSYLSRWHNVNLNALKSINDNAALKQLKADVSSKHPKGELFDDLATIKEDIDKKVIKLWIDGLQDKSKQMWRVVYKNENWEKSGYKNIKDPDLKARIRDLAAGIYSKPAYKKLYRGGKLTKVRIKGVVEMNPIDTEKTVKDYVAWLIEQKESNLPQLPDSRGIRKILAGINVTQLVASAKLKDPKGAPSKKLPEVPMAPKKKEKYVKTYRARHQAEIKKLKGITSTPIKDPNYPDSIVYQIYKDGKPLDKTYYRIKGQTMSYGLSRTGWVQMTGPDMCAENVVSAMLKNKYNLEVDPKQNPKIASMSYENGTLSIVGENLRKKPLTVKIPNTIKANIARGVKFEASDVGKIVYRRERINEQLTEALLEKVPKSPLRDALVKALKDPTKGAPILQKILRTGPKPKLKVYGRASWEGHYNGNLEVARKRARNAMDKIKKQIGNAATLVPVGIVVGPDGKETKNPTRSYIMAAKMWSKKFKKKIKSPEMKKIIKKYINGDVKGLSEPQVAFLEEKLDKQRGIDVEVVAQNKPREFTIRFESAKPTS
jgi:hypothetical protein